MSYLDLNLRLPELLLMRVDKMSMGVSLEGRVPFLDHKIVELTLGIPEKIKTRSGRLKHILKHAIQGLLPDDILNRPKQGFGVPIREWYLGKLGEEVRREIRELCDQTDFFDPDTVLQLLETGNEAQTWALLNLALWRKAFLR
jgi:asparagine synthase (glutamine-hydrolysing)